MTAPPIPKIFHFVFSLKPQTEPLHLLYYLCLESCRRVNRPERIYFYYRFEPFGRYWELIKDKLSLVRVEETPLVSRHRYRDRSVGHFRYAHHADFIRLEKLLETGGVYADMDTIFVRPFPERLYAEPFVLGREPNVYNPKTAGAEPSLCNALILSRRNSDFGRLWLDSMKAAFDGSWSEHSCFLPQRLSVERPEWIHVEPVRSFYKHTCSREGLHALFEGCDPDFEGVYSMHLWNHVWTPWWRRDFTRFHLRMLTEENIRDADTTYNLVARRFLPSKSDRSRKVSEGQAPVASTPAPLRRKASLADHVLTRLGLFLLSCKESIAQGKEAFGRRRARRGRALTK